MRAAHIGLIGAAVAVVGYTLVWLVPEAEPGHDEVGAADGEAARVRKAPADRTTRKFIRPLIASRMRVDPGHEDRSHRQEIVPPPPTPGEISPDDALTAFNAALASMDEALDKGKTSRRRKRELYSRASNAFTALSVHLDGADPAQRAVLEQAYSEMKQRMKSLKLKVPRRPGAVLEPKDH